MGCDSSQQAGATDVIRQPYEFSNEPLRIESNISNLTEGEKIADSYFQQDRFLQAIQAYQKVIEGGYSVNFDIAGVGNAELSISRYEWFMYRWYNEQRSSGKIKGNVYDALSLCLNQIRNTDPDFADKAIIWYEDMLGERQSVQLYIGYANALYNRARYEEALKMYNKVIKLKPDLINAYASIALLYEYRRIEKSKSTATARQILEKDPENMYAIYILARNQQNVDVKISKLKEAAAKFPSYVRIANDVGIAYGSKKQHRQAIVWYKKCVEAAPMYAAAHNNVGVRTEMLELYEQALPWYLKACELDHEYKAAHGNAIDIFDKLKYNDDQIQAQLKVYKKLDPFMFYYYLGLAYYDKKRVEESIKWYKKSEAINDKNFDLMNSFGISYDEIKKYKEAEVYYLKCIQLNPKYHMAYYNLGILYKAQGQVDKTIEFYKKATEVNPRYNKPLNNLGNIYKDRGEFDKAIECYKKAVEVHSTYTLCYANMGMCYLKLERYQDAFTALARAKEILPTDNNNLSEGNKNFLKENLALLDKEGEKWRKTGSIDPAQKEKLQELIKSFEMNFRQLYSAQTSKGVSDQKALKQQILQIVALLAEDGFELKQIDRLFDLIKHIFHQDEEYFHILPQAFIQYFWNSVYKQNKPILEVEKSLFSMVQAISAKEASGNASMASRGQGHTLEFKMKNFSPSNDFKVNLFKDTSYFDSYEILYGEIVKVNTEAEKSLPEFVEFVEAVRKRSNGIPYGVNMKMPKRADQQFKVILRILEKMFKREITQERVQTIITKIDQQIKKAGKEVTLGNVVHEIMDVWTREITLILQERSKNKIETTCAISDFVRGKIMFDKVEDLAKAVDACDKLCHLRGYEILELDNRLTKPQTMDVVLKIRVGEAVCEFQLAMRQDESGYHLIHCVYQIERSPLGCIFGSYLFMSKGFNYPLLTNCRDIAARLAPSSKEEDQKAVAAAKFIIDALEVKN